MLQAEEEHFIRTVEHINMAERLLEIQQKTQEDESLQKLRHVSQVGWPESKELLPPEIRSYSHFKEELPVQDGNLFTGNRVIIPK